MTVFKTIVFSLATITAGLSFAAWEMPPAGFKVKEKPLPMAERIKAINPANEGKLRLTPTYTSCSVCWGVKSIIDNLCLEYRENGKSEWWKALEPKFFDDVANYRGSILDLNEDTSYEVRLIANGKVLAAGNFKTWSSNVPIAKTIVLDPAKVSYPIVISDKGSKDGWIRYTTKPGAIIGSDAITNSAILVFRDAQNVILDGVCIQGGGSHKNSAVFIEKSKGVRILNCEIFGFGKTGAQVFTDKGRGWFYENAKSVNDKNPLGHIDWNAGVMIYPESEEVTVERCYIHDPRGRSNAWYYSHPCGMQGVFVYRSNGSIVLRWNDIVGSDKKRWNDAIEGADNFRPDGGFNRDSDIYGNFCIFSNDDCVELDGGQQNVRCFRNRFEAGFTDLSIQGCVVSPVYVYDNLLAPCCDEFGVGSPCLKTYGFDSFWYAPYAYLSGNYIGVADYKPSLGVTSRWDWRSDNKFVSNNVPDQVSRILPQRNLPFMLERGIIKDVKVSGMSGKKVNLSITARSTKRQAFRIRKNFDTDWFEVFPSEGELREGENVFKITIDPSKMVERRNYRGAFLVRTKEGLSRCVSIYAENVDFNQAERPVKSNRTVYFTPERPLRVPNSMAGAKLVEASFEVQEDGDYWFFARGKADWNRSRVYVSIDGSEFKVAYLSMPSTYYSWNMVRPETLEYNSKNGLEPFRLKKGLHKMHILPYKAPVTLTDFAVSDNPLAFEPR